MTFLALRAMSSIVQKVLAVAMQDHRTLNTAKETEFLDFPRFPFHDYLRWMKPVCCVVLILAALAEVAAMYKFSEWHKNSAQAPGSQPGRLTIATWKHGIHQESEKNHSC